MATFNTIRISQVRSEASPRKSASDFQARTKELVDACLSHRDELGVEIVYAIGVDAAKNRLFGTLGFREKTLLAGHYKIAEQRYDANIANKASQFLNLSRSAKEEMSVRSFERLQKLERVDSNLAYCSSFAWGNAKVP